MNLFAKQKQRHRCREQTYGYQGGKGGGMNWEIGIDIYTLLCIKQITNENLLIIVSLILYIKALTFKIRYVCFQGLHSLLYNIKVNAQRDSIHPLRKSNSSSLWKIKMPEKKYCLPLFQKFLSTANNFLLPLSSKF